MCLQSRSISLLSPSPFQCRGKSHSEFERLSWNWAFVKSRIAAAFVGFHICSVFGATLVQSSKCCFCVPLPINWPDLLKSWAEWLVLFFWWGCSCRTGWIRWLFFAECSMYSESILFQVLYDFVHSDFGMHVTVLIRLRSIIYRN